MIEPRTVPLDGDSSDYEQEPSWELIKSGEVVEPSPLPIPNHHRRTQSPSMGATPTQPGNKLPSGYPIQFNPKINTAGLFNTVNTNLP